jgi:hypothetical protein
MEKVSAEKKAAIIAEAPVVIRKLAAERDELREKLAKIETRTRVEKLAHDMLEKGIETGDARVLADRLEKQASSGELDLTRLADAVQLVGPNMGKEAQVADSHSSNGMSAFEQAILS